MARLFAEISIKTQIRSSSLSILLFLQIWRDCCDYGILLYCSFGFFKIIAQASMWISCHIFATHFVANDISLCFELNFFLNGCFRVIKCWRCDCRSSLQQRMSPERLILSHKYSISKIISSCEKSPRLTYRLTAPDGPAPLARSLTYHPRPHSKKDHHESLAQAPSRMSLKERARMIKSVDFQRQMEKPEIDLRRLKVEPFCGDVTVNRQIRPVFKNIIKKYKRTFHPSNASRGENNTSDVPYLKTPRRIRQMRDRFNSEDNRNEIRRLVVLNQVINQNNRKEVRMSRNKSHSRHLKFH